MSEYRVEKLKRRVSIVLTDGTRLEGDVFLRPISRFRTRPEEPSDLLNDAEPFFALVSNGDAVLVAKSNVARAETPIEPDEEPDINVLGVPVEVTLADGSVCAGNVFLEVRSDRPRLLDFLNSYHARFLPVVNAQHIVLVNTHTIAHVREVG
jgi:hypothetical protein